MASPLPHPPSPPMSHGQGAASRLQPPLHPVRTPIPPLTPVPPPRSPGILG